MSSSMRQPRHPKKSAFSCEACRQRKVKCGAEHPICNRCRTRGDACVYKQSPTLSYTQRLEHQVAELQAALNATGTSATGSHADKIKFHHSRVPDQERDEEDISASAGDMNMNDTLRVSIEGSTSLFRLPESIRTVPFQHAQAEQDMARRKESLMNSAWRERAFEKLADTPEPFRSLIDSHFCWIQPLFNFIYRPAFTRDMKIGGPYFSQALLNAVLSHSVRWCSKEPSMQTLLAPYDNGASFSQNAVTGLFEDIRSGSSKIPTLQGLLLLSAQECGRGNRTQAWLYSGMAFRLIDDMGICIDSKRNAGADQFSAEDLEIRNRLFWSCYFWDKLISLYFGRTPMLQHSDISPPKVLMDDTAELDVWEPHGLVSPGYLPKQAHSISCFIHMCGLAEILNEVLLHFYCPSRGSSPGQAYQRADIQSSRLRDWWRNLPDHLKIDYAISNLQSPPSHIVTLNCLYHTIKILLNRAMLKLSREPELASLMAQHNPLVQCISSATSIVHLFDLYTRSFGDGHVVLSLAYAVYTAASIFLLELQAVGHTARSTLDRLTFCLEALERLTKTNPVISTSANLIRTELEALGIILLTSSTGSSSLDHPNSLDTNGQLTNVELSRTVSTSADIGETSESLSQYPQPMAEQPSEVPPLEATTLDSDFSETAGFNWLDMSPDMLEAFLQIEPISVTMDGGFDV